MSHTIDDRIMELADEYTLNHSDEDYLSNKAMLNEFKQEMIEKACEVYKKELREIMNVLNTVGEMRDIDKLGEILSFEGCVKDFRKAMEL